MKEYEDLKEYEDYPWIGACDIQKDTEKTGTVFSFLRKRRDLNNLYKYLMETAKGVDNFLSSIQ